ncbi:GPW/gp25 family protein [Chitiniphilus eburneus]|uniref:GPW/gp25 family protein n=1 Tax=Chitiniphilus eburneus TaxID=2571148 RepID=UPI0035CEED6F
MSYVGMDAQTGRWLTGTGHLRQSVARILGTLVGTVLERREFGSELPLLIDAPINPVTLQRVRAATVTALLRWEPRLVVRTVSLSVGDAAVTLDLVGEIRIGGRREPLAINLPVRGAYGTN